MDLCYAVEEKTAGIMPEARCWGHLCTNDKASIGLKRLMSGKK